MKMIPIKILDLVDNNGNVTGYSLINRNTNEVIQHHYLKTPICKDMENYEVLIANKVYNAIDDIFDSLLLPLMPVPLATLKILNQKLKEGIITILHEELHE
jgi:hypothetical protein